MLVECGRLNRGTFIPFYVDDQANRRRLLVQHGKFRFDVGDDLASSGLHPLRSG